MHAWEQLEKSCASCKKCNLYETRTNVVFGVGDRKADIMFVGEGPGEQEDLKGEPFVGPAGRLLDDMLSIIDLNRQNSYIANVVKCRPPYNRDPMESEQLMCFEHLEKQIALVNPKIIVCLGRVAARRLIDPEFRITLNHGKWIQRGDIWMTAIYHPSALLRDLKLRPDTFVDLLALRSKILELGINIQRDVI